MKTHKASDAAPIAVIGMACRFPGRASNLAGFWDVLRLGLDEIGQVPSERFSHERYFSKNPSLAGHSYTLAAGVIEGVKTFDPDFFGISRKEAQDMDPQQRLALEMAWECLEQAQIKASFLQGSRTGVYFGASGVDNSLQIPDDPCVASPYSMTGANLSIVSNRISHVFDFHGPSLTVDTACSSSLLAVHLACEALRSGEISQALAGGVNILLAPYGFIGFSKAHMLSPEGRCKVFDASGDGYVRSEGGACILLKPLDLALKDKDNILGLIAGSGANSDGYTTGIALPNGEMQEQLLSNVYERFDLDKSKLAYVEAHGTGTAAGDPIEARSIGEILGKPLKKDRALYVGSVKGNIGHLEAASGMAGIIKGLLVLQNGKMPANLHFNTPNPDIDFEGLNLRVPQKLTRLPSLGGDELISVNSFGFGGANAHVVLRRHATKRRKRARKESGPLPPFFLSASSQHSLRRLAADCAQALNGANESRAADFAAALAHGRESLPLRKVFWEPDLQSLVKSLESFASKATEGADVATRGLRFGSGAGLFAFSGNGGQWLGMGSGLYRHNEAFRKRVDEIDALLSRRQNWSVAEAFVNPSIHKDTFEHAEISQILLFALQAGLVDALKEKGIQPSAVIGHSVGEVAAALASGALSLKDAATVIHYRSVLQGGMRGKGQMAAVNISAEEALALIREAGGGIAVSAVNSSSSITVAGASEESLRSFLALCKKRRIAAKKLNLAYPYHTSAMEQIKGTLMSALAGIKPKTPKIPFFSTVYGKKLESPPDAEYWYFNIRNQVLFAPAAVVALENGFERFLEIGPSPALRSYVRSTAQDAGRRLSFVPSLTRDGDEQKDLEAAWITAWEKGWELDFSRIFPKRPDRMELPGYAWNREYLWPEDTPENRGFLKQKRIHPLLGWPLPGKSPAYENLISLADFPWLSDHVVGSGAVYPAAAFLESCLAAAAHMQPGKQIELERLSIVRPLAFEANTAGLLRLIVDREDGGLRIESRKFMSAEPWGTYVKGRIAPVAECPPDPGLHFASPESFGMEVNHDSLYVEKRTMLRYGKAFRTVEKAWMRPDANRPEVLTKLSQPDEMSGQNMLMPPTLIDGAMQSLFVLLAAHKGGKRRTYLPVSFEKVILFSKGAPRYAHTCLERISSRSIVATFRLLDQSGSTLLLMKNCRFLRALWLEHEHADSRPYALELTRLSHPEPIAPLSGVSTKALALKADETIRKALSEGNKEGRSAVHPYLLLQLAALTAIHESVISLCGSRFKSLQCSVEELMDAGLLSGGQEIWLNALMRRLEDGELAVRNKENWQVLAPGDRARAEILWRTLVSSAPAFLPEAALLAHVFRRRKQLFSANSGKMEHDDARQRLESRFFSNSFMLEPYFRAAAKIVETTLLASGSGQRVNVLHISKNPTDLLADVMPLLEGRQCAYVVAEKDASTAEAHAIQFGAAPSLNFCVMQPEAPEPEHKGKYHLILLLWSLHEHLNSAKLLEACSEMLAPGGIVCVVEHNPNVFTDYVFGSSPSWWAASPSKDKPVSLLQGPQYWRQALDKAGFVEAAGSDGDEPSYAPAFIVTAKKAEHGHNLPVPETARPLPETRDAAPSPKQTSIWLIVSPAGDARGQKLREALLLDLHSRNEQTLEAAYEPQGTDKEEAAERWWSEALGAAMCDSAKHMMQVVFLDAYDNRANLPENEVFELQAQACLALSGLARAWEELRPDMRLWVISGGALADGMADARPVPSQGAVAGFARVMGNEMRRFPVRLLDVHGDDEAAALMAPDLVRDMLQPTEESEVVFAASGRYVPRLNLLKPRISERHAEAEKTSAALQFDNPGRLQNLYWSLAAAPVPAEGEVCVAVKYTGLNFRDVMWSMGMLPDEALENGFSGPSLGMECAGVIERVGKGVKGWKKGDPVICFAPACFGSHAVTRASAIVRKPDNMSFAEAATIPVAFITAWYSLKHLARLQPGESVLIHGAAGGVGLAAIQTAAHLGLEVYATAGSAEKQDFLRQLGVRHIYSSRSLAFAKQIMDDTQGAGVDAVLNSLAGEAIPAGLSVLRPFGRFLELGKRDFFADNPLRLRPFSNNISFYGIDVDQLLVYQPALAQQLFADLMELFQQRGLIPLPHAVYPVTRTVEAFQCMQQSSHIGKIVVSLEGALDIAKQPEPVYSKMELKADASYLITGGSGGFGLATANRMARRGAKHLILLSRQGLQSEAARESVANMRANGVNVIEALADVTDKDALFRRLNFHLQSLPPLDGVVHAAAALDDGLIGGLTERRIRNSLAAKALGALHLHAFTAERPLSFFVMYSSVSSVFGNPGQSMYVAANSALESLGAWRRSQGLPAQVIAWGPIAETGMMARDSKSRDQLFKVLGVSPSQAHDALYWLEHCIEENVGDSYYFGLDWHSRASLPVLDSPRYNRLRPASPSSEGNEAPSLDEIRALSHADALALVRQALVDEISRVLRLPKDRLNADAPLVAQGMDSLMAVELALAIEQKFDLTGYSLSLAESSTVKDLAASLYAHIRNSAGLKTGSDDSDAAMVRALEKKHGFTLSDQNLESVVQSMKDKRHE